MMEQAQSPTATDKGFWENLYRTKQTPWDIGKPAPPLVSLLKSPYKEQLPPGRAAVLGCGTGHEVLLLAQHGFEVTGIDFAPSAIAATVDKLKKGGFLGSSGYLLERDLFQLRDYHGYYDYVVENCTFCAIEPHMRRTYVWTIRDLLKPGGKFIALWWLVPERQGGPPYPVHKSDVFDLFDKVFRIELGYEPRDSVRDRAGQEFVTVMTAK